MRGSEGARNLWFELTGPRGWRSVVGPGAFALGSIGLLLYDHLQQRVPPFLFWLTLALIVCVFAWMIQTSRRQYGVLAEHSRSAFSDQVTGLDNRLQLENDIRAVGADPAGRSALLLFDLDGLQTYSDRFGYTAGEELVRHTADAMVQATAPLGGNAYRIDDSRLALLLPAADRQLGEIVLTATGSLREDPGLLISRAYGEVAIPDEAADPEVAMQFAGQRLAAHNQRQHRSARRQAHAVLMSALAARRPELRDHLRVVAYRTISLSRQLGLGVEEMDDVALAAELQDVGLLTVPEAVLEKEDPLTEDEVALIRNRPVAGERIISAAPGLAPVATLVRASAERFDGSGFPDGLAGHAIPLGSRIIAVAVAYAAMTAPRPYRSADKPEDALAELRRCAGTQFDPDVVEALAADLSEEMMPSGPPPALVV
jgi:HD-GYP domain-containing protein (c-di-GMP phosphodiesterase class II)